MSDSTTVTYTIDNASLTTSASNLNPATCAAGSYDTTSNAQYTGGWWGIVPPTTLPQQSFIYSYPQSLSEADVARIADAVAERLEARYSVRRKRRKHER